MLQGKVISLHGTLTGMAWHAELSGKRNGGNGEMVMLMLDEVEFPPGPELSIDCGMGWMGVQVQFEIQSGEEGSSN